MTSAASARRHGSRVASILVEWIDLDSTPRLILAPDSTLIWASAAAIRLIERGSDFEIRSGTVMARNRALQPDLAKFVSGCGPDMATLCLPSQDGFVLLRGREIRDGDSIRHIAISIRHSAGGGHFGYADLDTAFGFSPAELRVAMKMTEGMTAEDIAIDGGISIATVRTHIRNIYVKADVTSREALFARFAPFRL